MDVVELEKFLAESFAGDVYSRELRLSVEEVEYVLRKYPKARLTKMDLSAVNGEKDWYRVDLLPSAVVLENDGFNKEVGKLLKNVVTSN